MPALTSYINCAPRCVTPGCSCDGVYNRMCLPLLYLQATLACEATRSLADTARCSIVLVTWHDRCCC